MAEFSKVYCIVITYNGANWVNKCFESLKESSYPIHTIVIDNGSTDGTQEMIRDKFTEVELIQSNTNLGFGAGNNVGMKLALERGADFIFLLNQDAWIEGTTLETLILAAQANPDFGILSPLHLKGDGKSLDVQFSGHISPPACSFLNDVYANNVRPLYSCGFINAAAWLLTKRCVLEVGLFEPLFFMYGEDLNYVQRTKFHRLSVGLVTGARIVHDRSERKGKKSENGMKVEIQTFLYIKLFNVQSGFIGNFIQSLKVFVKYGLALRTAKYFTQAILKIPVINARLGAHKKKSYLLH